MNRKLNLLLPLSFALATAVACSDDGDEKDPRPGSAGAAGSEQEAGSGGGSGSASEGGGGSSDIPDAGGVSGGGVAGDTSVGGLPGSDEPGGGGQGGAREERCGGELAPPRARFTAYVVENELGQSTLFAAKSGAPSAAEPLLEVESPIVSLTWSPSGRYLAFVVEQGSFASSLHVVDFEDEEGPRLIDVATESGETPSSPAWSPDSTQLLYAEHTQTYALHVVDFSAGAPGAKVSFGNCPQGAYSEQPCLGAFVKPLRLEWAPNGRELAGVFVSQFFTDFSSGSAADLFLLQPSPDVDGRLASPFVPSFDPARRGVVPGSFVWSPDGAHVAYTGSFEDPGSVTEAYVFGASGTSSVPLKLHADLSAPTEGVRPSLEWASASTLIFASDLHAAGAFELVSIDVTSPGLAAAPSPQTLIDAAGGSVVAFGFSPDRASVSVVRTIPEGDAAKLTVFPYADGALGEPLDFSSTLAAVGDDFSASARWSADSRLLAVVEDEATTLSLMGRLPGGEPCVKGSFELSSPTDAWRWLSDESSIVLLDATGIRRLHGSGAAEPLSAPLEPEEHITSWAVQPLGK